MRISDWSSDVCSSDLLLPIPLLSLRTTLVIHALLPGFLVAKMLDRRQTWMMAMAVSNALLLYKVVSFASAEGSGNLLSTLAISHLLFRSEEHTSALQSLMRISYAVFCLKNKKYQIYT